MAKKTINLNELIADKDSFYSHLELYEKKVLEIYKRRKIKVTFSLNNEVYECSLANLITQMILLIPFVNLGEMPSNDFIVLDKIKNFSKNSLIGYYNDIINHVINELEITDKEYYNKLNLSIKESINHLSDLSGKFNVYSGSTISLHDLVHLYSTNKRFSELVDEEVPSGLDFSEIEEFVNKEFDELMDILEVEETCFKPYFNAKTGINRKQFKEIISTIALKADLDGNLIPYVIQANYLKGLNNITDFFIVSILARKALITSHKRVKESGYLTRKLSLLLIDTTLSEEEDCDTDEYAEVLIDSKDTASRYNLRYFLNENEGYLERFDTKIHQDKIGQVLKFRSPIKCKCKDGNVCRTCYGDLANVNSDIHIGIVAELELTEQLTQKLLSAKHLQTTASDVIDWPEEMLQYCIVDKGSIYIDTDKEKNGGYFVIDDDDLDRDEDNNLTISKFAIRNRMGNEIVIEPPIKLVLSKTIGELIETNPVRDSNNKITMSIKSLCNINDAIFTFNLENNELSTSLQAIIDLIESSDHLGITNIDEMVNKFLELLNEGDIGLNAVHAELILRELCRDVNDLTKKPERFDNEEDYQILKVSDGIFQSPSSAVSLSFEHLKKQIQSPDLYAKNGVSILDELYFN